jgi:hypothetical protein
MRLRYKIRGFANGALQKFMGNKWDLSERDLLRGEVSGYITVYFSAETVPSAWVLAYKYDFVIDGYPFVDEYKRVIGIDGHPL